jgi:hypothetical protein
MKTGGIIYAIGVVGTRHVHIGLTRGTVEDRVRALQAARPAPLTILAVVRVGKHLDRLTKHVQASLASHRLHGAWFEVHVDPQRLADLVTRARRVLTAQRQARGHHRPRSRCRLRTIEEARATQHLDSRTG